MTLKSKIATTAFLACTVAMTACSSAPKLNTENLAGTPISEFKRISKTTGNFEFNNTGEVVCEHRELNAFPKSTPAVATCDSLGIQVRRARIF